MIKHRLCNAIGQYNFLVPPDKQLRLGMERCDWFNTHERFIIMRGKNKLVDTQSSNEFDESYVMKTNSICEVTKPKLLRRLNQSRREQLSSEMELGCSKDYPPFKAYFLYPPGEIYSRFIYDHAAPIHAQETREKIFNLLFNRYNPNRNGISSLFLSSSLSLL